jgi:hypothetical protein
MRTITAEGLLRAWEGTLEEHAARRGAALLAGCDGEPTDGVAGWSVVERDAALFELRTQVFGTRAAALARCDACGEQLEVMLDLGALRPSPAAGRLERAEVDGYLVRARPPTSDDLVAVAAVEGDQAPLAALLVRCVEAVIGPSGEQVPLAAVPAAVLDGIRGRISGALHEAEVELELSCLACGCTGRVPFDIAAFLLREVEAWARQLLRDVHLLASTYGWGESAILGMSARRRQIYLEFIEAGR